MKNIYVLLININHVCEWAIPLQHLPNWSLVTACDTETSPFSLLNPRMIRAPGVCSICWRPSWEQEATDSWREIRPSITCFPLPYCVCTMFFSSTILSGFSMSCQQSVVSRNLSVYWSTCFCDSCIIHAWHCEYVVGNYSEALSRSWTCLNLDVVWLGLVELFYAKSGAGIL